MQLLILESVGALVTPMVTLIGIQHRNYLTNRLYVGIPETFPSMRVTLQYQRNYKHKKNSGRMGSAFRGGDTAM